MLTTVPGELGGRAHGEKLHGRAGDRGPDEVRAGRDRRLAPRCAVAFRCQERWHTGACGGAATIVKLKTSLAGLLPYGFIATTLNLYVPGGSGAARHRDSERAAAAGGCRRDNGIQCFKKLDGGTGLGRAREAGRRGIGDAVTLRAAVIAQRQAQVPPACAGGGR